MAASFEEIFESFKNIKALVIGDVMIDSYLWGSVKRISPEAPVPVVNVKEREKRLGGASNVALNLQSLGATPILCGVVGEDHEKEEFYELLKQNNLSDEGIIACEDRLTTVKHRIIAVDQHLLRVDNETERPITEDQNLQLTSKILSLLPGCQVVVFEDYDKGVITPKLIDAIVKKANQLGIPTVVDPKKNNFLEYKEVTLFKPNLKELREGLKVEIDPTVEGAFDAPLKKLHQILNHQHSLITLSEYGVLYGNAAEHSIRPAVKRKILDVSGAGDTVVSTAALALASGLSIANVAALSNLAGGLVCEQVGVVPIDKASLLSEASLHLSL